MKTHVFVVNDATFPSHLQHLFAGTGAGDKDFHINLLSDIKRVRAGDFVLFYIEATAGEKGGFYGIFKVANEKPLVFYTPGSSGWQPNLGKKLIYRTLIEPYEVYSEGVLEWEALDKLPVYATEIQWSLIYRKLKGKRGCTPILSWEAQRLMDMIRDKNSGRPIAGPQFTGVLSWDPISRKIVAIQTPGQPYPYPRNFDFNTLDEICKNQAKRRSYEPHLQLYFTENIGICPDLTPIVGGNVVWFGNEVACGVGMQKIDILTISQRDDGKSEYRLIELKDEPVQPEIVDQVEYYVQWASEHAGKHLKGAFPWNIQPVIVAPSHRSRKWQAVANAFRVYNQKQISLPILYFEFEVLCGRNIEFHREDYDPDLEKHFV